MVSLTQDQIKEIAEELDCGMRCYVNKETGEIVSVLDFECFQCITGRKHPAGDYEIESAIEKVDNFGRRHIDEMDPRKIAGIFDDDGYEIKPDLIRKPTLCTTCLKNYEPGQEDDVLCNLTRHDQRNATKLICHSYEKL